MRSIAAIGAAVILSSCGGAKQETTVKGDGGSEIATESEAAPLDLSVVNNLAKSKSFVLEFKTKKIHSRMCGFSNRKLVLSEPSKSTGIGIPKPSLGEVRIKAEVPADAICPTALGPYKGSIEFQVGESLPKLN